MDKNIESKIEESINSLELIMETLGEITDYDNEYNRRVLEMEDKMVIDNVINNLNENMEELLQLIGIKVEEKNNEEMEEINEISDTLGLGDNKFRVSLKDRIQD
ncbi:MAG: hypothetical protein ACOCQD_00455 [archaeon]